MKKFSFSLQKVLDYKQQILGLLKSELTRLQMQHREIEANINAANHEFENTDQGLIDRMNGGLVAPHQIAVYKGYLRVLNHKIEDLKQDERKMQEAIAAKQKEVVQMKSDISGLERLKDKQVTAYRTQERKEQETFLEEFVSHASAAAS
jgi:flagellar FliJ protein